MTGRGTRPPPPPGQGQGVGRGRGRGQSPAGGPPPPRPGAPPRMPPPPQVRPQAPPRVQPVTSAMSQMTLEERTKSNVTSTSAGTGELTRSSGAPQDPTSKPVEEVKKEVQFYRGSSGKPIRVACNYLKLALAEGKGIYEYEVKFNPRVDDRDQRFRLLNQQREVTGPVKLFDGYKVFLPHQLPDKITKTVSTHSTSGEQIQVDLVYKTQRKHGDRDVLQLFNILFNKIFRILKFQQHNRNFYDPDGAHHIKQYNLQVWPGYVTAVDEYEGGLLLQIDVGHRVLRTETVRDCLLGLAKRHGQANLKNEAEKALLGTSVTTRYNNKTYKVDDIDFDASPKDTFKNSKGEEVSYYDYYKNQYGIDIKDPNQPLIIHKPKKKAINEQEVDKLICLIPELCMMTGLTDTMRADFRIMKEVGNFTKMTPDQRLAAMSNFVKRVRECKEASDLLANWGLRMNGKPFMMQARQLLPETIYFGKGYKETVTPKADWARAATSKECLTPVNISKWTIVFVDKSKTACQNFCKTLQQQGPRMGIKIAQPQVVSINNDRTESYLKAIRESITPETQIVMTVVPQIKSDRYAGIKKLCCIEKPVASQVIVLKNITNEKKMGSVAQKVILQMNCKLGGELWACQTPHKRIMVVGIDVFHEKRMRSGSIAGVVASVNDNMSRFFSTVAVQREGQEIMDAISVAFMQALINYFEINHFFPENIVVFRDGVGDGQMETTKAHEVQQFINAFKQVKRPTTEKPEVKALRTKLEQIIPEKYDPGFNFVVVQKRINTRIFGVNNLQKMENPPPGTIVDNEVTRYAFKDFFLVPQAVSQGTVSPTHFVVLEEKGEKKLDPDMLQKLAYKLTHMYFNWPGTVRVPAPCQYAHKLVDLVGEHLHNPHSATLSDKLFFL